MQRVAFYSARIIFLWVAIHIGESIGLPLFSQGSFFEAIYAEGILLPQTSAHERLGDHRLFVPILVHEDYMVKIGNERVSVEEVSGILRRKHIDQPGLKVKLIVDQRCQMEIIHHILSQIRDSGVEEVYFTTSGYSGVSI